MALDDGALGRQLRGLRETGIDGAPVTQRVLARALGVSTPLISSWETGKATPSVDRLDAIARFYATSRSLAGGHPRLIDSGTLTEAERQRFELLQHDLLALRAVAAGPPVPESPLNVIPDELRTGSPWEGFWHFPDRAPITLVCARLPTELRASEAYSSPESPDYAELYSYSDLDALMELYGHVYAANPGVAVTRRLADELAVEDLTSHLVLLGGVDWNVMTRRVMEALNLPVRQDKRADHDPDAGLFRVVGEDGTERVFRSTVEGDGPGRRLTMDVAQFCRAPNPFNRKRTVTICNGNFGQGTYAAVRVLTDPRFRDRNGTYLEQRYGPDDAYSILARVEIVDGKVLTPDWTVDGAVLHEWSNRG